MEPEEGLVPADRPPASVCYIVQPTENAHHVRQASALTQAQAAVRSTGADRSRQPAWSYVAGRQQQQVGGSRSFETRQLSRLGWPLKAQTLQRKGACLCFCTADRNDVLGSLHCCYSGVGDPMVQHSRSATGLGLRTASSRRSPGVKSSLWPIQRTQAARRAAQGSEHLSNFLPMPASCNPGNTLDWSSAGAVMEHEACCSSPAECSLPLLQACCCSACLDSPSATLQQTVSAA